MPFSDARESTTLLSGQHGLCGVIQVLSLLTSSYDWGTVKNDPVSLMYALWNALLEEARVVIEQ